MCEIESSKIVLSNKGSELRSIAKAALSLGLALQMGVLAAEPVGPKLTERLRALLTSEMQQVESATSELAVAIAAGDHAKVTQLGSAVRDSFILQKSLTARDKKDLMSAVSAEFIALDRHFHATADKLAGAAANHDSELQVFYYSKMIEACIACHTRFAPDQFPGFADDKSGGHKH